MPQLDARHVRLPTALTRGDVRAVLDTATRLREGPRRRGAGALPLSNRNVALLCRERGADVTQFERSLAELGARVTCLDASAWFAGASVQHEVAARLLGRLYDVVDCCELPPPLTEGIAQYAEVPVFDGLAHAAHPCRLLAELLTMRDTCQEPLERLSVRIEGDTLSPAYGATADFMSRAGVNVQDAAADFVLDAAAPPARRRLLAPRASALEQAQIDSLLGENRRRTLQAMVVMAV